jgi:DNA-binding NtrC family response regulator
MLNSSQSPSHHHFAEPNLTDYGRTAEPSETGQSASFPFVGVSAALRRLLLQAEIVSPRLHLATIEGEPGTGKHLFAQTIHRLSRFAELPFRRRDAREWLANETDPCALTGTLYLERVDLLTPVGQGLLLNFVKTLQPHTAQPRFLLLVSVHAPLRRMAVQSLFQPDLAFRLSAIRFSIPPLREHREDIASFTHVLIDRICRHYQQPIPVLAQGTLHRLLRYNWPGNVRELASVIETAVLDSTSGVIRPVDLALPSARQNAPGPAGPPATIPLTSPESKLLDDLTLDAAIHRHLQLVLQLNRGNKLRAARQLGISRSTLYRLLAGDGISPRGSRLS